MTSTTSSSWRPAPFCTPSRIAHCARRRWPKSCSNATGSRMRACHFAASFRLRCLVLTRRSRLCNSGTTPFAHVSTCIRSHVARASQATPAYEPLLVPFELVGALTPEEVRAVGLHAEQRPAVKRGTLWYLNPRVLGFGIGADDPFVRCRREAGLAPSDRDGLYARGLVPLQHAAPALPPALTLSSTLFTNTPESAVGSPDEGDFDEEGMGRGKRKRRASSAMMAAMGREGAKGSVPSPLGSGSSTPVPIPAAPASILVNDSASPLPTFSHRRSQSTGGPASAPARSGLPKLKFRLSSLEEVEDSDGHTGEAAQWRKKNKKKTRRAGSEGVSRAGSVESSVADDGLDEARALAFSSASSSALLAQSLLAASTIDSSTVGDSQVAPHSTISPDILSLGPASTVAFPFSRPSSTAFHLSASAPNIFSHHFTSAPSPPDVLMDDSTSDLSRPNTAAGVDGRSLAGPADAAASPASDSPDDNEDDFHEAMLRGDDFDFEWGYDSFSTNGTSSLEASAVAADLLAKAFEGHSDEVDGTPRGKAHELSAGTVGGEEDEAAVDTPATTPRSLPHDSDDECSKDEMKEEKLAALPKKSSIEPLREPISRVGMSITLCDAMSGMDEAEDRDAVIVKLEPSMPEDSNEGTLARRPDRTPLRLLMDSPVDVTARDPYAVPNSPVPIEDARHRLDHVQIPAPPPSPLSLELTPTIALSNAFAATDYDFVGRDEAEGLEGDVTSPSYAYTFEADDEAGENEYDLDAEEILHVKSEDEEAEMAVSSAPSSRAGSSAPALFDMRLLASVRAASVASSSSESDTLDPMSFVSPSTLATGLPVPQAAPSPPETNDWTISLDMLDDLDLDASAADLLGPENIGLEELDLAWAGDEESLPVEHTSKPSVVGGMPFQPTRPGATFLTGSTNRFTSPMPSPRRLLSSRLPSLSNDGFLPAPAPPTTPAAGMPTTAFGDLEASTSSPLSLEAVIPLEPSVVAKIVQRGIVVFGTDVSDLATGQPAPLLRRLDTDYVNATVLLQAALSSPLERASALATLLVKTDTFRVPSGSGDAGVEGTWIPLAAAEDVVATYPEQLGHLSAFFGADLAAHFPEPVPTMRNSSREPPTAKRGDPNAAVLGTPSFAGAELLRRCGPPFAPRELALFVHDDEPAANVAQQGADGAGHDADDDGDESTEEEVVAVEEDTVEAAESTPASRPKRESRTRRGTAAKVKAVEHSPPRRSTRRQSMAGK